MADKIIPFQRKPEQPEPVESFFVHECVNVDFALRMDGIIVCAKCGEEIGWYTLNGHDD